MFPLQKKTSLQKDCLHIFLVCKDKNKNLFNSEVEKRSFFNAKNQPTNKQHL